MIYCWLLYFFVVLINLLGLLFFYDPLNSLFQPFENNPATLYMAHLTVIFSVLVWYYLRLVAKYKSKTAVHEIIKPTTDSELVLKSLVLIQMLFLFFLFTVFDGYSVLTQAIYRGEWRSQFGLWGPVVTSLTKFLIPGNFIYFCLVFLEKPFSRNSFKNKTYLFMITFITFLCGLCLGGKTSAVYLLLGGALIFLHHLKLDFKKFAMIVVANISIYFMSSLYFDGNLNINEAIDNGLSRFTYVQAEPIGIIYQKILEDDPEITPYFFTLFGFVGNQGVAKILNIDKNSEEMTKFNYSRLTTYLTYPHSILQIRRDEYNITAGVFIEGILALGRIGFLLFSALNAMVAAYLLFLIQRSLNRQLSYILSTMAMIYFLFVFIPWTNSGGITILFHVVTVFSMVCLYVYFVIFEWIMSKSVYFRALTLRSLA